MYELLNKTWTIEQNNIGQIWTKMHFEKVSFWTTYLLVAGNVHAVLWVHYLLWWHFI